MRKKIILIQPDHFAYSDHFWMPTNIIFLASALYGRGYYPVIIDDRIMERSSTLSLIEKNVKDSIMVAISTVSGTQLLNALQIARSVKDKYEIPVVFGGAHPSAVPLITMSEKSIDYIVSGRGENIICELCDYISGERNLKPENIPNLYYRGENGDIVKSSAKNELSNLNKLPPLIYFNKDIFDVNEYLNPKTLAVNYATSTGCVGNCTFCYYDPNYNYSFFDNRRVISDLSKFKRKYNIRNISFDDPTFLVSPKRIVDLAKLIIQENLDVKWKANARLDFLMRFSLADLETLKQSGCYLLHVGLESGSERILKLMNKKINVKNSLLRLEDCKKIGIGFSLQFILGIPTETIDDLKMTAALIKRLIKTDSSVDYTINFFMPFPGNDLTRRAVQGGFKIPSSLSEYTKYDLPRFKIVRDEKNNPKKIILSPWKDEVEMPWFTNSFKKEYLKFFRESIPEKKEIVTTGNIIEDLYE